MWRRQLPGRYLPNPRLGSPRQSLPQVTPVASEVCSGKLLWKLWFQCAWVCRALRPPVQIKPLVLEAVGSSLCWRRLVIGSTIANVSSRPGAVVQLWDLKGGKWPIAVRCVSLKQALTNDSKPPAEDGSA